MFQNELDKVKAELSVKGEFQPPTGVSRSWALPVLGGLPRPQEPLSRAHPSLKLRVWCRQPFLKVGPPKAGQSLFDRARGQSLAQLCCNWGAFCKLGDIYAVFLLLFLITSY